MDSTSSQSSSPTDSNILPRYRHAAPSGPWPWMDFSNIDVSTETNDIPRSVYSEESQDMTWLGYPQEAFKNWTPNQVNRSQMFTKCSENQSTIYWMDVLHGKGEFSLSNVGRSHISTVAAADQQRFWGILRGTRPENVRVRSLFVDDLTSPVLRMLGTKYNIEPFFFTSSINFIPSRYQEALNHGQDHITITLPFVRTVLGGSESQFRASSSCPFPTYDHTSPQSSLTFLNGDTLSMDLLAIHMIREVETSTIISYHPKSMSTRCQTSAKRLHSLILLVGESVYWQDIFSKSKDPTFLLLAMLWYALYAWDESLESLDNYVTSLVSGILKSPSERTCDPHALQARLLYYESLLRDFQVSISFIENTPNPALESAYEEVREASNELMKKECGNLLGEIERLEKRRRMLRNRLKNMLDIVDSSQTERLIKATEQVSSSLQTGRHTKYGCCQIPKQLKDATARNSAAMIKLTDATARNSAAMRHIRKQLTHGRARNSAATRQIQKQLTDARARFFAATRQIQKQLTDATARDSAATRQIQKQLTDARAINSAAMRQILYVTTIFLLANFVAPVFMVNDKDVTPYGYLETFHNAKVTIAPMLFIACIVIIIQMHTSFQKRDAEAGSMDGSFPLGR
ncbi:hypothetical protein M405DRAFT_33742 [Rhizopogon salebrosus TDB-379]|nr:hypothetical protein M405DRAFT_33742 [Rhizopogon salebrosus TDB-379]